MQSNVVLKVYYIDDEPELCENFCDCYASGSVEIQTFLDPVQAIAQAKVEPPDLIFVDYRMPQMTGDKVALAMDSLIPKVLITGDLSLVTDSRFLKVLFKPCKETEVEEIIYKFQELKRAA